MAGGSRRRLGATRFDFLASAFLASENLFCRQMSGEEDSVGAPGVFRQRIRHTGADTAGGGTTGGITAMEEKKEKKQNTISTSFSKCGCGRGKVVMGRVFGNFDVLSLTCMTGLGTN